VALVPVDTLGVARSEGAAIERVLSREVERSRSVSAARSDEVRRALERAPARGCRESDACLASVGRGARADLVLSATLAGLGELRLVRARLVRARDELVLQDVQETIPGGVDQMEQRAAEIARRLFPERGPPWHRRWWVWSALAGVVATVGLTVWLVERDRESGTDPNLVRIGDL
jgi:hypothetical protein